LQPLNDLVWIFNSSPIHFSFHFTQASGIQAGIHNWDIAEIGDPEVSEPGVPVEFSTDPSVSRAGRTYGGGNGATMDGVLYNPIGGVFTFNVYTPAATYWFKISRTKYKAIDQRVHYKGDIVRCSVDGAGSPVIVHVRDFVKCGVQGGDGKPVLRRGAANLV